MELIILTLTSLLFTTWSAITAVDINAFGVSRPVMFGLK